QEPPDDYCNRVAQAISYADTLITDANDANANTFTDAHKADIYKSQMGGKYLPVPAQYPNGTNIDTPARFRAWLRFKYQQEMVGTQQVAIQRLASELFMPTDTPETYENRIRPFVLGVPNNDANALGFLMKHLPDELFTRMKVAQPTDIDAFFTNLKNMWMERKPSSFNYGSANNMNGMVSQVPQQIVQQPTYQPPQQIVQQPAYQPPQQIVQQPAFQPPQQIVQQPVFQPPQQIVQQPELQPFQRNFRPKTEKAKYYEELKNYAEMGLEVEDNRVLEPMEIDYAIINKVNQIKELSNIPEPTINATNLSTARPIQRKCEICKKLGHTYRSCPVIRNMVANSKKKTGRVNFADGFQQSHSDTEELPDEFAISDQEEDNISDGDSNVD
ncbi:2761_t:CDS:1, partial [Entrophospora sp. SA101]